MFNIWLWIFSRKKSFCDTFFWGVIHSTYVYVKCSLNYHQKFIEWDQPKGNHIYFTWPIRIISAKKILGWYFMECLTFLKPFRSAHSGMKIEKINAMNKNLCISPLLLFQFFSVFELKKKIEIQTQCCFP